MKLTSAYIWTHPDGALCIYAYPGQQTPVLIRYNNRVIDHHYDRCVCDIYKWLQQNKDETH